MYFIIYHAVADHFTKLNVSCSFTLTNKRQANCLLVWVWCRESICSSLFLLLIRRALTYQKPKLFTDSWAECSSLHSLFKGLSCHSCSIFNVLPSDLTCLKEECESDAKRKYRGTLYWGCRTAGTTLWPILKRCFISCWPEGRDQIWDNHVVMLLFTDNLGRSYGWKNCKK